VVVELLHHPVAPWLARGDKPRLDPRGQTEADQGAHPPGVSGAPVEAHLVVGLDVLGEAQALPRGPERVDRALAGPTRDRFGGAPGRGGVHRVQTPEPHGAPEVAGAEVVHLVDLVGPVGRQCGIGLPRGDVPSRPSVPEAPAGEDPVDSPHRREGTERQFLQPPADVLGPVQQPLVVQLQPDRLDRSLHPGREGQGMGPGPTRAIGSPRRLPRPMSGEPLVHPAARSAQRGRDRRRVFARQAACHREPAFVVGGNRVSIGPSL
jgi:hypothetical protein